MKNISLKTKFLFFISTLILIFISYIFISFIGNYRINQYSKYYNEVKQIHLDYLSLLESQKNFFIFYPEDESFFKTGNNKYIRQNEIKFKQINKKLIILDNKKISKTLKLNTKINNIIDNFNNQNIIIDRIIRKLHIKGSQNSGTIEKIYHTFKLTEKNTENQKLLAYLLSLKQFETNYLLTKDLIYYQQFLSTFSNINNYLSNQNTSLNLMDSLYQDSTYIDTTNIIKLENEQIKNINNYKKQFTELIAIDKELGNTFDEGLYKEYYTNIKIIEPQLEELEKFINEKITKKKSNTLRITVIASILIVLIFIFIILIFSNSLLKRIENINKYIYPLRKGAIPNTLLSTRTNDEITHIAQSLNKLIVGLKQTTNFATKIGDGVFSTEFNPLSNEDVLGNSLLQMRQNLQKARKDEKKRQDEDKIRQWTNEGIAKFAEILRQTTKDIKDLSTNIVKNLVNYLNANQGGVFLYNDENRDDVHLSLIASYAFNKERKKQKKIILGEGLIGTCAIEKESIYMTDIPNDYVTITSGLGGANPRSLFITPLKLEDQILGVIEIASFNKLHEYEREFIEKVTESIASTLSITKINQRTSKLLAQAQKQAEEMATQEEEMRQNLEELLATQDEATRSEAEMKSIYNAIDKATLVTELDLFGNIINANENLLKLFNFTASQYVGKNITNFDDSKRDFLFNKKFTQKINNAELIPYKRKFTFNNKVFNFQEIYTPILDAENTVIRIMCISTNMTEREKLELKITQKAQKYREKMEELDFKMERKNAKIYQLNKQLEKLTN